MGSGEWGVGSGEWNQPPRGWRRQSAVANGGGGPPALSLRSFAPPLPAAPVPDVRALIDRIAHALGDQATPERVEHIARAVLQAERTGAPAPAPTSSAASASGPAPGDTRFVVTAYGRDTPGVLAALTSELAAHGANVLDVSQKVLQGYFTVVLFADLPADGPSLTTVRDRLQARGEPLGARVLAQHEELFQAMHRP